MRKISIGIGLVLLITITVSAIKGSQLNELLSESLDTYNRYEKIRDQRRAASKGLNKSPLSVRSRIELLEQPAFDEEQIANAKYENIAFYRSQIAQLNAFLEIAKITDPNERAKLAQKYEKDRQRLLAEELAAGKPFRKRTDNLKDQVKDKQELFEKAIKAYCLLPKDIYPDIVSSSVDAEYHAGKLTYKWKDTHNNRVILAWIWLKDKPVVKDDAQMLNSTYYVSRHNPNAMVVWAGNFRIDFHVAKTDWWGREKIVQYIKDLIDLDGLAKIDPTRSDNSLNALTMESMAYAKKYRVIRNETREVVNPIRDERVKVKMLKSRLKKPPAGTEQLKKDRDLIDNFTKELEACQKRLEIGLITDPNERAAMKMRLQSEKKKLGAEKKRIIRPYDDKIKKLRRQVTGKDSLLNDMMKVYFLDGGNGYEGISEKTTKTRFYQAVITCNWKDSDGNILCTARLRLRNKPVIPEGAQMLDGIYHVSSGGGDQTFIKVWAGNFNVFFKVKKQEWLEKEGIGEILKNFVDLPGLAKLQVPVL
ncbi:hypothetical protein ACFL3G_03670 [Planctomycetota bacterium]